MVFCSVKLTFKRLFLIFQLALIVGILTFNIRAAGEVDPTFNVALQNSYGGTVRSIVVQPDGKYLVAGNLTVARNSARTAIVRFNADGTVDQTFDTPEIARLNAQFAYTTLTVAIHSIALQADGKIIIGGDFTRIGTTIKRGVARLNADGSLDTSFTVNFSSTFEFDGAVVYQVSVVGTQIYIGGKFTISTNYGLARLNADGSTDTTFATQNFPSSPTVRAFGVQADGKVVFSVASESTYTTPLRRVNADGSTDASFPDLLIYGRVLKIVIQPDGKILVGGTFGSISGFAQNNILRLNPNGNLDVSFNANGTGADEAVNDIALLPDGRILIGGSFTRYNNSQRTKNARLNADGTLDASAVNYNLGTSAAVYAVASIGDGRAIIGGEDVSSEWINKLARLNTDGTLDANFKAAIYQRGTVSKVLAQPDGKVLIAGVFSRVNETAARNGFTRLNADGTIDTTFSAAILTAPSEIYTIALQPDGKILIGGAFNRINGVTRYHLARLNADGTTDTSFQYLDNQLRPQTEIRDLAVLPDGKILGGGVLGGTSGTTRLNSNGSRDNTFQGVIAAPATANDTVNALEVLPDGKFVIVGGFTQINGVNRGRVARMNADGSLDTTFNPPFGANNSVRAVTTQSNGNIIIGGWFNGVNGVANQYYMARFFPDGTLDANFNPAPNAFPYALERQADDKILVGGYFTTVSGIPRSNLARINANGTLDTSFAPSGTNDTVRAISIQTNEKIIIGGDFTRVNGLSSVGVARLLNPTATRRPLFDFDGDGKADVSVFRPSSGFWYRLNSQNNAFAAVQFGQASDKLAPADYDGDGKTDIAVFREGSFGYFYILDSATNTFRYEQFGTTGDAPLVGDWDGDGKADVAVYREAATSNFYYRPTTQPNVSFNTLTLGTTGDKPLYGDFDGDGKLDAAVFRASNATWYIQRSSNSQLTQTQFGVATDIPVPADYDGDGIANIAVFRPSTGYWYTNQNPATNYGGVYFGTTGDTPVPADYDGDGKADVAVFRPSTGAWYLNRSTAGFTGIAFGASEDKPIPNAFIRVMFGEIKTKSPS